MFNRENGNNKKWCLDSGCTAHICTEKVKFEKIENVRKTLNLANSESTSITGVRNVRMIVSNGNKETNINFEKVYYRIGFTHKFVISVENYGSWVRDKFS